MCVIYAVCTGIFVYARISSLYRFIRLHHSYLPVFIVLSYTHTYKSIAITTMTRKLSAAQTHRNTCIHIYVQLANAPLPIVPNIYTHLLWPHQRVHTINNIKFEPVCASHTLSLIPIRYLILHTILNKQRKASSYIFTQAHAVLLNAISAQQKPPYSHTFIENLKEIFRLKKLTASI